MADELKGALQGLEARVRNQAVTELSEKLADCADVLVQQIPTQLALKALRPPATITPLELLSWLVDQIILARAAEVGDKAIEELLASAAAIAEARRQGSLPNG